MSKLSVTFSQVALGTVAFLCFAKYSVYDSNSTLTAFHGIYRLEKPAFGYFYVTLFCLLLYAIFGLIATGIPRSATYYRLYQDLYAFFSYALFSAALPCYSTEIWLSHGFWSKEIAYAFLAIGILATVAYFCQSTRDQEVVDFLVVLNMGILLLFGFTLPNIHITTAWIFFSTAYGVYRVQAEDDSSLEGFSNYCLALFTYFIYKSVTV